MTNFDEFIDSCPLEAPNYFELKKYYFKPPSEYVYTYDVEWSNTINGHFIYCNYINNNNCNTIIVGTYPGATEGWYLIDKYKGKKIFKNYGKK